MQYSKAKMREKEPEYAMVRMLANKGFSFSEIGARFKKSKTWAWLVFHKKLPK